MNALAPVLVERVLAKLGLSDPPGMNLGGLAEIYAAWCRGVPFDNVRKLIHLHEQIPGPLPGDDAEEFLEAWLAHGTGGTCWAGNGALQAVLASLGFAARRGYATMLAAPNLPPNHGTVIVAIEGRDFLVDASILFHEPMSLENGARVDHPAWGVAMHSEDGKLHVRWRPFHMTLECRIESVAATRDDFVGFHEATRSWGPFNYALSARLNQGDSVIGASFGQHAALDAKGVLSLVESPSAQERTALLVDRLGISEEMAARLPPDQPLPPPPKPAMD